MWARTLVDLNVTGAQVVEGVAGVVVICPLGGKGVHAMGALRFWPDARRVALTVGWRWVVGVLLVLAMGLAEPVAAVAGWRVQRMLSPGPTQNPSLNALSCASRTACTAVGFVGLRATQDRPLAERWNGRRWSVQPTPNLRTSRRKLLPGELTAVSCPSRRACMAVGISFGRENGAIAERWDGHHWAIEPVAAPAFVIETTLTGVSCTSPKACIAVGGWQSFGCSGALMERWDGSSWSILPAGSSGNPCGPPGLFTAVSCTSATSCMGAGSGFGPPPHLSEIPFAGHWTGTGWSLLRTPNPTQADNSLSSVSCSSDTACTAVGNYGDGDADFLPLAERWDGSRWSLQRPPRPKHPDDTELNSVSCAARAMCVAVGFNAPRETSTSVVDVWQGERWLGQTSPTPLGAVDTSLSAVSCVSRQVCTAVGSWTTQSRNQFKFHLFAQQTTNALASGQPKFTG